MESTEEGIEREDLPGVTFPRIRALAARCVQALPVDGVAIGVRAGSDTAHVVHATDRIAAELEEVQFTLGEGPCVDAFRRGHPVLVPDLEHPAAFDRWPGFAHEACAVGAGAVFAFPLHVGAIPFGTVVLYRAAPGALTGIDLTAASLLTDQMIRTVLDELAGPSQLEPNDHDAEAAFGRVEIPQATGMVAVQLQVDMTQAMAHLRAAAFAANRPVLELAEDIVARRITFANDADTVERPPDNRNRG